ncbi:MAG: radical SAM protein [Lachnospiraceae bacterium]|nr:radical SAM protein [Lachnospiraceae bacterium]
MAENWNSPRQEINYSHYTADTTLLGPYHRGVLWVQGCCFSCEGCIAQSMHGKGGSYASCEALAAFFLKQPGIEGLTISGGEPFLQAEALWAMMEAIRYEKNLGLIVYSGMYLEEIQKLAKRQEAARRFLSQIDLLIDGRYEKDLDDGRMAVGSSNQTIHLLTDRYRDTARDYYGAKGRKTQICSFGSRLQMIGVPSAGSAALFRKLTREKA